MISKESFIKIYLLKSNASQDMLVSEIREAEKIYDEQVISMSTVTHHKAAHILMETYVRRKLYFEKLGKQDVNPVWAKEEIDALREIWDSFDFLVKVTNKNTENKINWGIGKRP